MFLVGVNIIVFTFLSAKQIRPVLTAENPSWAFPSRLLQFVIKTEIRNTLRGIFSGVSGLVCKPRLEQIVKLRGSVSVRYFSTRKTSTRSSQVFFYWIKVATTLSSLLSCFHDPWRGRGKDFPGVLNVVPRACSFIAHGLELEIWEQNHCLSTSDTTARAPLLANEMSS